MNEAAQVRVWRSRLARATKKREDWITKVVKPNIEAIWGEDKPQWWPVGDPWVDCRIIFSAMRASLPSLLFSDPEFKTLPKRPMVDPVTGKDAAWQVAKGAALPLNHYWRESEGKKHARVAIQNALFSLGVCKAGYAASFQDDNTRGEFDLDDDGNFRIGPDGLPLLKRGEYATDKDGQVLFDEDGVPVLHKGKLLRQEWYVDSVDPRLMLFDPEGTNVFTTHRWVAEEWVRPLTEVKADERFPARIRSKIRETESLARLGTASPVYSTAEEGMSGNEVADDAARVRGYDIFDFVENRYYVLAAEAANGEANERFLLKGPMPDGVERCPYTFLRMNEKAFEWYPEADVTAMRPLQQEYKEYRSMKRIHRDHARNRICEAENAFWGENHDEQRELFTDGADGVLVKADASRLVAYQKPAYDPSFQQDGFEIRQDFDQVAVQAGEMRGIASARSATQASLLQSNAEIASDDRRDNLVQTFLAETGRKLFQAMQATMTQEVYARVETPEAENPFTFVTVTPDMIAGEYDIDIKVGSTLAKNDPRSMMMMLNLFQTIAQNPWIGTVPGFVRRAVDAMGLDESLTAEIIAAAEKAFAQQAQPPAASGGGAAPTGQNIQELLTGMTGNAAGGASTGAPTNEQLM